MNCTKKEMDKPHQHAIDIGSRSNDDVWSFAFDVGGLSHTRKQQDEY
jgi:hypothetical protein